MEASALVIFALALGDRGGLARAQHRGAGGARAGARLAGRRPRSCWRCGSARRSG